MTDYKSDEVVSISSWVGILILLAIPFVNIITILCMAFGSENKNHKNYGRAALIVFAIIIGLSIVLSLFRAL